MRQQTVFKLALQRSAGLSVRAEGENPPEINTPKAFSILPRASLAALPPANQLRGTSKTPHFGPVAG
jgi:hypothetical protein